MVLVVAMPKRRVTAARKRQMKAWQLAGQLASLRARHGSSHPSVKQLKQKMAYKSGALGYTPPGMGGRRTKLGGKAYTKKTQTNFRPAKEAVDILAGKRTARPTPSPSQAMGHNGPGLKPSPRGGGHKIAPKPPKQTPAPTAIPMHGSGTGLTSAYRYLPVNVAARKRQVQGKKAKAGKHHGTF